MLRKTLVLVSLLLAACSRVDASPGASAPASSPDRAFAVEVVGRGRPMILIPGLACSGHVWDSTVARYRDRYELHVLTLAGFAGQPPIDAHGDLFERVTKDLASYIRARKLDAPIVVGHSLGGVIAYELAEEAPDVVGPIVAVDGVPFLPALVDERATSASSQMAADRMRVGIEQMPLEKSRAMNRRVLATMITSPADVERAAEWEDASDRFTIAEAVYEGMTTDLRPRLASIRSPVLLVASGQHPGLDAGANEVRDAYEREIAAIPDHRLVVAANARHFVMLDDPNFLFAQIDGFLAEKDRGHAK